MTPPKNFAPWPLLPEVDERAGHEDRPEEDHAAGRVEVALDEQDALPAATLQLQVAVVVDDREVVEARVGLERRLAPVRLDRASHRAGFPV